MIDATPLLHLYARRRRARLSRQDPVEAQRAVLRRLVAAAKSTRFGIDHGFERIDGVEAFRARVPLRRYEQLWGDYWQAAFPRLTDCTWPGTIPYFAVTSGTTTGVTKHIPCSREIIRQNSFAAMDLITHHLTHRPHSQLFAGRNFMLGGSTRLTELAPGIWSGDLSGIVGRTKPLWARPFYFPPRSLETIADWEEKIARLAPASLDAPIRAIGGTPSWLLLFFEKLAALRPSAGRRLAEYFPDLEMLVHGGVNFAPYRAIFGKWLEGSGAETREVYPASEGFIAVADRGDGEGLRMIADRGLFFEFVPADELGSAEPTRHWLADAELGVNYALVLSTCAGLWAYIIGDTVRLIERTPPRLLITGRTSYSLSAFGEHLIGEEIENAVAAAARAIGTSVTDYAVGALFPERDGDVGRHLFVVEFDEGPVAGDRLAAFAGRLDAHLAAENEDYAVHRERDFGMGPPVVHAVATGTFAAWMKRRGRLGGQNKVPRVVTDDALFTDLRRFAGFSGRR
jgi:hypothetical protein